MNKYLSLRTLLRSALKIAPFVLFGVLCIAYTLDEIGRPASADETDKGTDTIDDDGIRFSLNYALPVELVEEGTSEKPLTKVLERTNRTTDKELKEAAESEAAGSALDTPEDLAAADQADEFLAKRGSEKTTLLNVKDAEITALIKTFSKLTKRNYVVDSGVKGKVTIHLPTPVTIAEALRIFDSVLLLKGYTTVPIEENTWKVVASKDAKQTTIPIKSDGSLQPSDQIVTEFVRLSHVAAADMQKLLTQYISPGGVVNSFSGSNSLIIIDSQANIVRLKTMIKELDVPALDQDLTIIPIQYADAKDIAEKINQILGEDEDNNTPANIRASTIASRARARSAIAAAAGGAAGTNIESQRTLPLKVIPDERTNSLIVLADPELTVRVRALVERLDSAVDLGGGRFYVYRVQHADAEELAEIINNVISGTESSESGTSTERASGSSISRSQRNSTTAATSSQSPTARLAEALRRRRLSAAGLATPEGRGKVSFEGDVNIAPDPATNSLIINASRGDYERVRDLIKDLDIKRPQVIVEATILEVTLNKEAGLGTEWQVSGGNDNAGVFAQTNYGGLTDLVTNPGALSDLTIAAASTGTITLPGGLVLPSQGVLVTALSRNSNVNVLSAPTIVTTDNEEAEIIVGENVPFVTSTSTDTSNINNTFNSIERQDVGITLRITPQISTGEFVNLKIFVEISNVVNATRNDPNGPTTTIRTTETTVDIKSGQMVVTGGLISDNSTESTRGVPFLEDIPVLGYLFKRADTVERRTNLLIFITPKIIEDQFAARDSTQEYRNNLNNQMLELEASPRYKDILYDRKIDRVVEESEDEAAAPTTIRPPKKITVKPDDAKIAPAPAPAKKSSAAAASSQQDEIIDVTVAPKLPGGSTPRPMLSDSAASFKKPATVSGPRRWVVLRALRQPDGGDDMSFQWADKYGTIGLVVAGNEGTVGGGFFSPGGRYSFQVDGEHQEFVCLGNYDSQDGAAAAHKVLSSSDIWYQLSPKETIALGQGPWKRSS
ncbi:MAG: type II secretion system secretin GspD [Bdellovibrionales bacterium]|nr:type II secretion system secretin GspD [Bdellovibrionales bacterium]